MSNTNNKKVILAFSGGLDTSFAIPYLIDQGYEVITMTANSGGFNDEELKVIKLKSKKLGATKHYETDVKDELYEQVIKWTIKGEGLYEGSYPNLCADRYVIAEKSVEIAKKEGAKYIAHGSTAMGNDQVRFNLILQTLAPEMTILEPIKEMGGNREEEIAFLKEKGFEVSKKHSQYSINENVMGITYSGSEIDQNKEADNTVFKLVTNEKIGKSTYYDIEFVSGLPISINGINKSGIKTIQILNTELGQYGYGKEYYTGNCMVGIKGHIAFEAPALFLLIKAHKALKQYVLTHPQMKFTKQISEQMAELIYTGKIFDPFMDNLKAYIDSENKYLTGTVKMKIEGGNATAVSVTTKNSLINLEIATYAQGCSWTPAEANGFIKLYGMQTSQAHLIINKNNNENS